MRTSSHLKFILTLSFFYFLLNAPKTFAQEYQLDNAASELKIYGTSSLHDWHETVEEQKGQLVLDLQNESILSKLNLELASESLKSGKRGMDKNTYKALKTGTYKTITFKITEIKSATKLSEQSYNIHALGNLTVAGTTKPIMLDFKLKINGQAVTINGEKTIKMTDFNIDPPKALLGTITTGDEITIKFKTLFKE